MDAASPTPGDEAILAASYRQVIAFLHARAARGDLTAHRLGLALRDPAAPPPARVVVRRWLADVAAESRVYADPDTAAGLIADLTARERLVPASAERLWRDAVAASRG